MAEMIERVARALYERDPAWYPRWSWQDAPVEARQRFCSDAYAAIKAMRPATVAMSFAGHQLLERKTTSPFPMDDVWCAMIDAALAEVAP